MRDPPGTGEMKRHLIGVALLAFGITLPPAPVAAECKLAQLAELPVTMNGLRGLVAAKINGKDARFIADSGAFWSVLTPAAAEEFRLPLRSAPFGFTMLGIGGVVEIRLTTVDELTLANIPLRRIDFIVGGSEPGAGAAGLLGQNVLRVGDVEYDYANGVIRLLRPTDCRGRMLAYWAHSQPYSVLEIESATQQNPRTKGSAFINGTKISVQFDTGAATSVVSLRAAERAGVRPGGPDVVDGGVTGGSGRGVIRTWIGPFASFKIGDEEIRHTRLRIGEVLVPGIDMLIGADFFLSHHIYVANSQAKLYFTYNGGPVFNLATAPQPPAAVAAVPATDDSRAEESQQPADAASFARRGAAYAARRDYEHAVADLNRACELAPTESAYFYARGSERWELQQRDAALADFDQALELRPDEVNVRVARAQARLATGDHAGAIADLDAADANAPKSADVRAHIGHLYARLDRLPQAIAQFDQWIGSHALDGHLFSQLNARCWARALLGRELDKALSDCNAALKLNPTEPEILDSRGLVHLRRGEFDQSIADYDAALRLRPELPWSLYGRGLAKLHKGMAADGESDIAAARAVKPQIEEDARRYGIVP
jgi:tetratricopeptide (TPR) repeat protein/predicted aspartyl protease